MLHAPLHRSSERYLQRDPHSGPTLIGKNPSIGWRDFQRVINVGDERWNSVIIAGGAGDSQLIASLVVAHDKGSPVWVECRGGVVAVNVERHLPPRSVWSSHRGVHIPSPNVKHEVRPAKQTRADEHILACTMSRTPSLRDRVMETERAWPRGRQDIWQAHPFGLRIGAALCAHGLRTVSCLTNWSIGSLATACTISEAVCHDDSPAPPAQVRLVSMAFTSRAILTKSEAMQVKAQELTFAAGHFGDIEVVFAVDTVKDHVATPDTRGTNGVSATLATSHSRERVTMCGASRHCPAAGSNRSQRRHSIAAVLLSPSKRGP